MSKRSNASTGRVRRTCRPRAAFTLIELLVVVAIIALLISILLPSLGRARAQARATVCGTRIAQITKAILLYADDYDETPPFMGLGWEDVRNDDEPSKDLVSSEAPGDLPTRSEWEWATLETWLSQHPEELWNGTLDEEDWDAAGVGPKTGMLFKYTRFENLYRCPDFERIAGKSQSSFNYARTVLGRRWIIGGDICMFLRDDPEPEWWGGSFFGAPGPIMKISQAYAPAEAIMMFDEWWERHIGAPYEEHSPPAEAFVPGGWMANDCIHYPLGDELGRYHGSPKQNEYFPDPLADPFKRDSFVVKQGSVCYYDGHAAIQRQWWAGVRERSESDIYGSLNEIIRYLCHHIFSVRGRGAPK